MLFFNTVSTSDFFFKNINRATQSDRKLLLLEDTMSPAVLKTLSEATLVAGMQR